MAGQPGCMGPCFVKPVLLRKKDDVLKVSVVGS